MDDFDRSLLDDYSESHESRDSRERLEVPRFEPAIPAFLAERLTEQERYIIEAISRMEQQGVWLSRTLVEQDRRQQELVLALRDQQRRIARLEKSWIMLSAKKAVISVPLLIAVTAAIGELVKWIAQLFKHTP